MDPRYSIKPTPYGGRGLFATTTIPKGDLLLNCEAPYAFTIYRKFRKEVCHYCFAYSFDSRRNSWSVRHEAQPGLGSFYFCSEACREEWVGDQNADGMLGLMHAVIDKASKVTTKKPKQLAQTSPLENLTKEEVTLDLLDTTWKKAEAVHAKIGTQTPKLDEFELDMARFVASVLVQRYCEDKRTSDGERQNSPGWQEFLELQNNELEHIRARPFILDCYIRIYGFLCKVAPPALQCYLRTSFTTRLALGKESGNAFGLWETSTEGDKEMFGWGSYISASFFNHDCSPNIRRERVGRSMVFLASRDIEIGEELCISYVDVEDGVVQRSTDLLENWYFTCGCSRCKEEAGE